MKIDLILPRWDKTGLADVKKHLRVPPLSLATIAALTPSDVEVRIVDENVERVGFAGNADLIAISAMTPLAPRAYEIAAEFRAKGVPVVLGGMHPSLLPAEAINHADSVMIGEAEGSWQKLIEDLKNGTLQKFYRQQERPSLENLPIPRRYLYKKGAYAPIDTVQISRGCPYGCEFCSVTRFFGKSFRFKPIENIIKEMETLKRRMTFFVDDNIIGNPRYAKKLFEALIPLNIKWFSQSSVNIAHDDELLKVAAESGCICLFVGFESLSQANLKEIGKSPNEVGFYREAIKKLHDYGISVEGAFIFGFDHDKPTVFRETVDFAKDTDLDMAQFGILTPFPGTALYDRLESSGRITNRDWANYDVAHVVSQPKLMTPKELWDGFYDAWQEFYSVGSIVKRLIGVRKNLRFTLPLNLGFRRMASMLET